MKIIILSIQMATLMELLLCCATNDHWGHIDVIIEAGGWIVLRYIGRRRMATPTVYRVGCIDCKITRLKSIKVAIIGKIRETTWIGFCLSLIYFNKFKYNSLVLRGSD